MIRSLINPTRLALRASSIRLYSSTPPPTKDDSHPHLYFHHLPPPSDSIALSYLPDNPGETSSSAVVGWLPNNPDAGVSDFKENTRFKTILHESIRKALESDQAATVSTEALTRGTDGFMHIADERNLPPSGRIPEPEDIIGSVYVLGGKVQPETYEPQPMHRLLTSDGCTVLPYGIDEFVLARIKEVVAREKKGEE